MNVEVFTDTTSDIPQETADELGIHMIPLGIAIDNQGHLDRVDIDIPTVITAMVQDKKFLTTASPGVGVIYERLRQASGKQIFSVVLSSDLSGVYKHTVKAAEDITPPPVVVDSRTASMALGFLAIEAAKMAALGKSAGEIEAKVRALMPRTVAVIALDNLTYAHKGGRVTGSEKLVATVLDIKPILMAHEGKIIPVQRVRTWGKATARLHEIICSRKFDTLAVMSAYNEGDADKLIAEIPRSVATIVQKIPMGAAILSHSGPVELAFCGILAKDQEPLTPEAVSSI